MNRLFMKLVLVNDKNQEMDLVDSEMVDLPTTEGDVIEQAKQAARDALDGRNPNLVVPEGQKATYPWRLV